MSSCRPPAGLDAQPKCQSHYHMGEGFPGFLVVLLAEGEVHATRQTVNLLFHYWVLGSPQVDLRKNKITLL